MRYQDYKEYTENQYIPRKDHRKHIGLDISDIPGASPVNLKIIKGVKRSGYFPDNKVLNDYYNKESSGARKNAVDEAYERFNGP